MTARPVRRPADAAGMASARPSPSSRRDARNGHFRGGGPRRTDRALDIEAAWGDVPHLLNVEVRSRHARTSVRDAPLGPRRGREGRPVVQPATDGRRPPMGPDDVNSGFPTNSVRFSPRSRRAPTAGRGCATWTSAAWRLGRGVSVGARSLARCSSTASTLTSAYPPLAPRPLRRCRHQPRIARRPLRVFTRQSSARVSASATIASSCPATRAGSSRTRPCRGRISSPTALPARQQCWSSRMSAR